MSIFHRENRGQLIAMSVGVSMATVLLLFGVFGAFFYFNQAKIQQMAGSFLGQSALTPSSVNIDLARSYIGNEQAIVETVAKANPAVVSIVISKDVPKIERFYQEDPFDSFFGPGFQFPQFRQNGTERREVGGGSGFLVSSDGMIVTNRHVVQDPNAQYSVFTSKGEKYEAKVMARDPVLDIAILKIEGASFPYLEFGNSDNIALGQTAIAIGNALSEFRNSVSVGVISGLSRSIVAANGQGMSELLEEVIQTDTAINPGNSGGPLLDSDGMVIGVNVAVARGSENIGFALPANTVKSVIESVQKDGKIVRPFIGIRYQPITPELKEKNNLSVDYGVIILRGDSSDELAVVPGSPADRAGITENDIILEIDEQKLDGSTRLANLIRKKQVGETIQMKVLQKGEEKILTLELGTMPE